MEAAGPRCPVYLLNGVLQFHPPQISGSMTAAELTCQVLDLRNIHFDKNDYWSCWEVNEKEEIGEFYFPAGEWLYVYHTFIIR